MACALSCASWPLVARVHQAYLTVCNNLLFFQAKNSDSDTELWTSGGTDATTERVKNINMNGDSNPVRQLAASRAWRQNH